MSRKNLVEARVARRVDWNEGLFTLTVDQPLDFEPGQFTNLALELDGELVQRPYSIASAPGPEAEFYVALVPEGRLTPHLHRLREGDPVLVSTRCVGLFTTPSVPACEVLWLVATGTGLAPFLSMLRRGEVQERFGHVVLVHGARVRSDLSYAEELDGYTRGGRVTRLCAVTREEPGDGVLKGRLPALFADGTLQRVAGRPLEAGRAHVMMCGNPGMIEELQAWLEARDMPRHRARQPGGYSVEAYW